MFDLLGWLLSTFSPVQHKATSGFLDHEQIKLLREDFLVPLLQLYGRWCFNLATTKKKIPSTVEITVRGVTRHTLYFALGASVSGTGKDSLVVAKRKDMMRSARLLSKISYNASKGEYTVVEDTSVAPAALLALLNLDEDTIGSQIPIWNPNMQRSSLGIPGKEDLLRETYQWEKSQDFNGQITFSSWRDLEAFARKWLNEEVIKKVEKGEIKIAQDFGNCAETYPLLMLIQDDYK